MRQINTQQYWETADVTVQVVSLRIGTVTYENCYRLEYGYGMVEIYYRPEPNKSKAAAYPLREVAMIEYIFPSDPPVAEETTQTNNPSTQLKPRFDGKSLFG